MAFKTHQGDSCMILLRSCKSWMNNSIVFLLIGTVMLSDLHEETCQEGSLNVEGVAPGAEGGH